MEYWVLAFYHLTPLEDPVKEVAIQKEFFEKRELKGRLYISKEGINAQMSGTPEAISEYQRWMEERFGKIGFKVHQSSEQAFPKATIKAREQLVALDRKVDLTKRGEHVSAEKWDEMLEEGEDTVVLDVRNDYEWKVGHFESATLPNLETFREFSEYAKALKEEKDPKTTRVMMYCTGGIRCEFYSALLKEEGFDEVYQLDGGVIQYGLDRGQSHWKGKLFVFDDRMVIPISEEEAPAISQCSFCESPADIYYNCANMDCNALFIACKACSKERGGCCSEKCRCEGRVRPNPEGSAKPFRKWDFAAKQKLRAQSDKSAIFAAPEDKSSS